MRAGGDGASGSPIFFSGCLAPRDGSPGTVATTSACPVTEPSPQLEQADWRGHFPFVLGWGASGWGDFVKLGSFLGQGAARRRQGLEGLWGQEPWKGQAPRALAFFLPQQSCAPACPLAIPQLPLFLPLSDPSLCSSTSPPPHRCPPAISPPHPRRAGPFLQLDSMAQGPMPAPRAFPSLLS